MFWANLEVVTQVNIDLFYKQIVNKNLIKRKTPPNSLQAMQVCSITLGGKNAVRTISIGWLIANYAGVWVNNRCSTP